MSPRLLGFLAVAATSFTSCPLLDGGCVHGSGGFVNCSDDTQSECLDVWCSGDTYCGFFSGSTCESLGFTGDGSRTDWSEPRTPDTGFGSPGANTGTGGGSGATGGGTGSATGACAFYQDMLGRSVCDPGSTASSCTGNFLGVGTTCSGFSCTTPSNPATCTVAGSGGPGGTGGGSGTGGACDTAWTCTPDGQAGPMCQAACLYTGQQRASTCSVLVSLVGQQMASQCCSPYCQ